MTEQTPFKEIDAVIHEPARLAIVSTLAVVAEMSFGELKDRLTMTDGNLSSHARTLEEAGIVEIEKSFRGRRPHTALRLTKDGRKAFQEYLRVLQQIIDLGRGDGDPTK